MASGILGKADVSATTNTTIFTVTTAKVASFSVNFCNRSSTATTVRLALCASGTPSANEYIMYDVFLEGNGMLERTGLVAEGDKLVVVYCAAANVSVMAYGYEE